MNILKKAVVSAVAGITMLGCLGGINTAPSVHAASVKGTGVTKAEIDRYISHASLKQKIGQMFVSRTPQTVGQAEYDARKYNLGGFVVYDADLAHLTKTQFKNKLARYEKAANVPLLIGIDQEGGLVSRLTHSGLIKQNGCQFEFPRDQYKAGGMHAVLSSAHNTATLLRSLNINWNYAPDADYSDNPNSFIYLRGFGGVMGKQSFSGEAKYIKQVIPQWQHNNLIAATLKHFPGYGDAADTHTGFAETNRSAKNIESKDMLPFKAGIKAGADSVMVTHVIYKKIDPKYPASLSKKIDKLIRHNCHFNGVVVTDALEMGAITNFAKRHHTDADILAIEAGNDMIMATDYAREIPKIAQAVKKGKISERQINASVKRILVMKNKIHLLSPKDLTAKKTATIKMNRVTYPNANTAVVSGKLNPARAEKIELKDGATGAEIASTKATGNGRFSLSIPAKAERQSLDLAVAGKDYYDVTVPVQPGKHVASTKSFTLNPVHYNRANTRASISGRLPDAAAEGSVTLTLINTRTNKVIGAPVPVGGGARFASTIPLTHRVQHIQVVASDASYRSKNITVKALTSHSRNNGTLRKLTRNARVFKSSGKAAFKKVLKKGRKIRTYGRLVKIRGRVYYRIGKNQYVKASSFSKLSHKRRASIKAKHKRYRVMQKANIYSKKLRKVGVKQAYSKVTVYGQKKIKGRKYLRIGNNKYLLASKVTGTLRKLRHNARIFKNNGKTAPKRVLKKGRKIRTYGTVMRIKGHAAYRIGKNQYVKAGNFSK